MHENTDSEWLYTYTENANTQYAREIKLTLIHSGYMWGSDQNSFRDHSQDGLFYEEYQFNDYYHSVNDLVSDMNISYATKGIRLEIATLAKLAEIVT